MRSAKRWWKSNRLRQPDTENFGSLAVADLTIPELLRRPAQIAPVRPTQCLPSLPSACSSGGSCVTRVTRASCPRDCISCARIARRLSSMLRLGAAAACVPGSGVSGTSGAVVLIMVTARLTSAAVGRAEAASLVSSSACDRSMVKKAMKQRMGVWGCVRGELGRETSPVVAALRHGRALRLSSARARASCGEPAPPVNGPLPPPVCWALQPWK
jgi:hypothetical protein